MEKNIDLAKNKAGLETRRTSDGGGGYGNDTTPILAKVFSRFNPNVKVLPNLLILSYGRNCRLNRITQSVWVEWRLQPLRRLENLAQVLPEFMRLNPNVILVILVKNSMVLYRGSILLVSISWWCPTPAIHTSRQF